MNKLLVIIPIYDSNENITDCIESVLTQTLKDIEISIIVDAAFSRQISILKTYADKDKRIKIIYKKDNDYNTLINHEIQNTNSEYITILETNCIVFERAYEVLYINAKKDNLDIVKCGGDDFNIYYTAPDKIFMIYEHSILFLSTPYLCNGIYKLSFMQQFNFLYEGYYQYFPLIVEIYCRASKIFIVKEELFSIKDKVCNLINNQFKSLLSNLDESIVILKKYNSFLQFRYFIYTHIFKLYFQNKDNLTVSNKKEFLLYIKDLFNFNYADFFYLLNDSEKLYLDKLQKYDINKIIYKEMLKRIKSFFIESYDEDIYHVIKILKFVKITLKPNRLRLLKIEHTLYNIVQNIYTNMDNIKKILIGSTSKYDLFKYLFIGRYDLLFLEVRNLYMSKGVTEDIINIFYMSIYDDNIWDHISSDYWLLSILCFYKMDKIEIVEYILFKYINRYGTLSIHRFLLVSKIANKFMIKNEKIDMSVFIYNSLKENEKKELLKNLIRGKKLAIVGNAPSEIGTGNGKKIDSYDIVVRINNYVIDGYENDYGTKTDIWIRGFGGLDMKDYSLNNNYLLTCMTGQYEDIPIWLEESFNIIYRDLKKDQNSFCFLPQKYHKEIINEFGYEYPSTGLIIIYTLYKMKKELNETLSIDDIFGFSFKNDNDNNIMEHYFKDRSTSEDAIHTIGHRLNDQNIFLKNLFNI